MERKRLTRSSQDKVLLGVAGGLAEYFEVDATLVRVLWVVSVIFAGFGLLLYLIMAIVIPRDDEVGGRRSGGDALAIAEERFARGEISAAELREIREALRER